MRRRPAVADFEAPGLHPLLSRVYRNRGVASVDQLELGLAHLLPPSSLRGAEAAAVLLADSLAQQQSLLVVGDFDADGATSTALAVSTLRCFGAERVDYLVPNRFDYGYGLTPEIVALAAERSPDLIITVDNGISSIDGVAAARERGIETLVTDHHLAGRSLPAAAVVVNPNQPGCDFPSKALAGVGVIFYVMLALRAELRRRNWFEARGMAEPGLGDILDLVALGTVADVVPLDHNNRILVDAGLKRIRAGRARPGIQALLEVAGRGHHNVVASDLGFAVGPRLNAAGRLDDMSVGIECLLSEEPQHARRIAAELHQLNQDRRNIERGMERQALEMLGGLDLDEGGEPPLAVTLYEPDWHQGVIGILASRVKERMHRPTIAFANADDSGEEIKGSARSIQGIHIRDVLDAVATRHPGLITKFGGHAMAAGLSLPRAHYEQFNQALVDEVARHAEAVDLQAVVESDGELTAQDIDLEVASILRYAGPWGQHFPEPLFDGRFRIVSQRIVGERHLKLVLSLPDSAVAVDAIAFNIDTECWPDESVEFIQAAYRLDVNEYRSRSSVQLMIEFLQPAA
ncbi:single-stranded-DNA-specific exonuclease RecJ [Parahaliea maris]|uniref:Single-stranded-DNA-specific exonuclease RecJ n=1 Tax=Parahaliea maris TaxID=2716870 RepID=A0A5C9A7U7_9GAMM|nr:single-stranded-DNA-specific exonuclease RecJ [Parahaliea maris]